MGERPPERINAPVQPSYRYQDVEIPKKSVVMSTVKSFSSAVQAGVGAGVGVGVGAGVMVGAQVLAPKVWLALRVKFDPWDCKVPAQ